VVPFIRERSSLLGLNGQRQAAALMVAVTFWYEPPLKLTMLTVLNSTVIPSGFVPAKTIFADSALPP
jgi:hypothetical protein